MKGGGEEHKGTLALTLLSFFLLSSSTQTPNDETTAASSPCSRPFSPQPRHLPKGEAANWRLELP